MEPNKDSGEPETCYNCCCLFFNSPVGRKCCGCCIPCSLSCNQKCIRFGKTTCGIFNLYLFYSMLISLGTSIFITCNYVPLLLMNIESTRDPEYYSPSQPLVGIIPVTVIAFYLLIYGYRFFLATYISFTFNAKMAAKYDLKGKIDGSMGFIFYFSFIAWLAIIITWAVYLSLDLNDLVNDHYYDDNFDQELADFMNDKIGQLTSVESPIYWSVSLVLSPTYLLFAGYLSVCICTKGMSKRRRAVVNALSINDVNDMDELHTELLTDGNIDDNIDDHDVGTSIDESGNADCMDTETEWQTNRKYFYRMFGVHTLLLATWIIWKWITTPFASIDVYEKDSGDFDVQHHVYRNNVFLSYWGLYIFTTIMKYICIYLSQLKGNPDINQLLFNPNRVKIIIDIFISILFSFGMKFVFTNVGNWTQFIIINIINCTLNILIQGSFQSHQYGKRIINKLKELFNKLPCLPESKQLKITDFSDINEVLKYNKDLAFRLVVNFIISSSSSLIVSVYFVMTMVSTNAKIDDRVYEFMAASFGVDCIIFFGEIFVFKKRDRKYFLTAVHEKWRDEWSKPKKFVNEKDKTTKMVILKSYWLDFIAISLFFAWFWIGNVTGCPTDIQ